MKLIVESTGSGIYAYIESEAHHERVHGKTTFDDPTWLDHECNLALQDVKLCFDLSPKQARQIVEARKRRKRCSTS